MDETSQLLGYVELVEPTNVRGPLAQLAPVCKYDPSLRGWTPLERGEFPNRGWVTWFHPVANAVPGSVWVFSLERQPTFDEHNPLHDLFRVSGSPLPCIEVMDVREYEQSEELRSLLVEEGMFFPFNPTPKVVFWLNDETFLGPVNIVETRGCWRIEERQSQNPLPCFAALPLTEISSITIKGVQRRFLPHYWKPSRTTKLLDWAPNEVTLKRVLKRLRKNNEAFSKSLDLTEKSVNQALQILDVADSSHHRHAIEIQQITRAKAIVHNIKTEKEALDDLYEAIVGLPPIKARIEAAESKAREDTEASVRKALAEAESRTEFLAQQIASREKELETLEHKIAEKRQEFATQVETVDKEISDRLASIVERPERELANIAVMRAALRMAYPQATQSASNGRKIGLDSALSEYRRLHNLADVVKLSDMDSLRKSLLSAFHARKLPTGLARLIHGSFVAGAMPVLAGHRSYDALQTYSDCVAASRMFWLSVPPTLLDCGDVLARQVSCHMSHRSLTLYELLLSAHSTEELSVLVLDGVNKSAVDGYLLPLLSCYADSMIGKRPRHIPSSAPPADSSGSEDDERLVTWPGNVLLAGILNEGVISIPPGSEFWTAAYFIDTEQFDDTIEDPGTLLGREKSACPLSVVSLPVWTQVLASVKEVTVDSTEAIDLFERMKSRGTRVRTSAVERSLRFSQGSLSWPIDPATALQDSIACCLVPWVSDDGANAFISVLEELGLDSNRVRQSIERWKAIRE